VYDTNSVFSVILSVMMEIIFTLTEKKLRKYNFRVMHLLSEESFKKLDHS
jgi:hypothetical protein